VTEQALGGAPPEGERSVGELVKELVEETRLLVRQEARLAKTELGAKAKVAVKNGAFVGAGALCAFYASLTLLAALVLALGTAMPLWAAALVVGLLVAAAAAGLAFVGVTRLKKIDPRPRQTIRTMRENKVWLQEQMSR
jgi:hypothetical protein